MQLLNKHETHIFRALESYHKDKIVCKKRLLYEIIFYGIMLKIRVYVKMFTLSNYILPNNVQNDVLRVYVIRLLSNIQTFIKSQFIYLSKL